MNSEDYTCGSIYQAAYLLVNGAVLEGVTFPHGPGSATFVFSNKDGVVRRMSQKYFEDTSAPAKSLFEALGKLKREANIARREQGLDDWHG